MLLPTWPAIATNVGEQALRKAKNGVYCGPLRLLAMEVAEQLNAEGIYCNLLTGECCVLHREIAMALVLASAS